MYFQRFENRVSINFGVVGIVELGVLWSSGCRILLTPLLFYERLSSVGMGLRSRVSVVSQVNADEWALIIRGASGFVLIRYKSQRLRSRLRSRGSLKMFNYDVVF